MPPTISRRLHARQHFLIAASTHRSSGPIRSNPGSFSGAVNPSRRDCRRSRLKRCSRRSTPPMDKALSLLMLRCGLRVSEVAHLNGCDIDWSQHALRITPDKGHQDRQVYRSADAVASLGSPCWQRPSGVPEEAVFWNQKRPLGRCRSRRFRRRWPAMPKPRGPWPDATRCALPLPSTH